MQNDILSGILGACIGDILGVPVEFMSRKELVENPVIDLREYGTHNQPKGTWSDDTSMTLCTIDSLATGLNYDDMMQKFSLWLNQAEYTPHGEAFDIGNTTYKAIENYTNGEGAPSCGGDSEYDNGNGSLMRILPISFYLYKKYGTEIANDEAMSIIHRVSSLTHRHKRSHIACGIYIHIAVFIMSERNLQLAIDKGIQHAFQYYQELPHYAEELNHFYRLWDSDFSHLPSEKINSSGYVVDTLEAAIWCLENTKSYQECVLKAVNLGEDTDTVAAVAGGFAGLYYGINGIPEEWFHAVVNREFIEALCDKFYTSLSNK